MRVGYRVLCGVGASGVRGAINAGVVGRVMNADTDATQGRAGGQKKNG